MDLHAAHAGLRLTSADFWVEFTSVSRNTRHSYESPRSGLSSLIFISTVLLSHLKKQPGLSKVTNERTMAGAPQNTLVMLGNRQSLLCDGSLKIAMPDSEADISDYLPKWGAVKMMWGTIFKSLDKLFLIPCPLNLPIQEQCKNDAFPRPRSTENDPH